MSRTRFRQPRPNVDNMSQAEKQRVRAELEARLDRIRDAINAKRLACGMIEISDGVWIAPDQAAPVGVP